MNKETRREEARGEKYNIQGAPLGRRPSEGARQTQCSAEQNQGQRGSIQKNDSDQAKREDQGEGERSTGVQVHSGFASIGSLDSWSFGTDHIFNVAFPVLNSFL